MHKTEIRNNNYTPYNAPPPPTGYAGGSPRGPSGGPMNAYPMRSSPKRSKLSRGVARMIYRGGQKNPSMMSHGNTSKTVTTNGSLVLPDDESYLMDREHFYIEDGPQGAIYQAPPPKPNLNVINQDPSLGGVKWTKPTPPAPCPFNKACSKTPMSNAYRRVIPWDNSRQDFVYEAISDEIFRGFFSRRALKNKIDFCRNANSSWVPTNCYNIFTLLLLFVLIIGLITFGVLIPIFWQEFKDYWEWWIIILIAGITILVFVFLIARCGAIANTKKRYNQLCHACDDLNWKHLRGSGVQVKPGHEGAWLDIYLDPSKTRIMGPIPTGRSGYNYNGMGQPQIITKTTTTHVASQQGISVDGIQKSSLNENSRTFIPSRSDLMSSELPVAKQSVYESNYQNGTSSPMGSPRNGSSAKKQAFLARLAESKREANQQRASSINNLEDVEKDFNSSPESKQISLKKQEFLNRVAMKKSGIASPNREVRSSYFNDINSVEKDLLGRENQLSDKKQQFYEKLMKQKAEMKASGNKL